MFHDDIAGIGEFRRHFQFESVAFKDAARAETSSNPSVEGLALRPALGGGYAPGQKIRLQTHTASPLQIFIDANERESGPEAILFCNRCPVAKLLIGSPALGHIFSMLPDYISQVHSEPWNDYSRRSCAGIRSSSSPCNKGFLCIRWQCQGTPASGRANRWLA